ncbi:TetR/AcrR family transcriptional regulator [Zobellella sp. DQSA1]|uniref:TetR/AcrR family transcriptional regulator n=1 Tax=Zobellella sp. DQSA1 TaxID=3342386 RepID=UPI0035C1A337
MKKRTYQQKRRAEQQEQTRERIVEATMALHQELGPRDTTISAIAERAGVQRLTVYRHFPDDQALFQACTSRWLAQHRPPDPASWQIIDASGERLRTALAQLYGYFRSTARMWTLSYRDEAEVTALQAPMARFHGYLQEIRDDLAQAYAPAPVQRRQLDAVLAHCVDFPTWQSLAAQGLDDAEMVRLVECWVKAVAEAATELKQEKVLRR